MELVSNKGEWVGWKRISIRLSRIMLGYAAAVLVATTTVLLPFGIFANAWASGLWLIGILITGTTAFFPTMLFILINETRGRLGPYGHIVVGVGVALVAHLIFQTFESSFLAREMDFTLVSLSCLAGAAGALTYWKIAVAHLQENPFRIDFRKVASVF